MPFVIGGALAGGGALIGGLSSAFGASKQADAAKQAASNQMSMYSQTAANLFPYRQTGNVALNQIRGLLGLPSDDGTTPANPNAQLVQPFGLEQFQASPAYQFNLQQGQMALDKAANARGNYYAPQTLQDISKFSQGLASNEFQNAFSNYNTQNNQLYSRLMGLAGAGQNAAALQGGFGAGAAANAGNFGVQAGNAQAAGIMGVGNALTGGLQNAYNLYQGNQNTQQLNQILAQLQGGTPTANSAASMPGGDYMTQLSNPSTVNYFTP